MHGAVGLDGDRGDTPDFRTISEFCRRHVAALAPPFVQVLKPCEQTELVKLGHVALDGTKTPPRKVICLARGLLFNLHPNLGAIIVFDLNAELLNLLAAPL